MVDLYKLNTWGLCLLEAEKCPATVDYAPAWRGTSAAVKTVSDPLRLFEIRV